jgi:hypothetical protein
MIPFTGTIQETEVHRDRRQIRGCWGLGGRGTGVSLLNASGVFCGDNEIIERLIQRKNISKNALKATELCVKTVDYLSRELKLNFQKTKSDTEIVKPREQTGT